MPRLASAHHRRPEPHHAPIGLSPPPSLPALLSSSLLSDCVSTGAVANCFPQHSCSSSLLMADIRCLYGMEGSPAVDRHCLSGLLTRPLRQKGSSAEIQKASLQKIPSQGMQDHAATKTALNSCAIVPYGRQINYEGSTASGLFSSGEIWTKAAPSF